MLLPMALNLKRPVNAGIPILAAMVGFETGAFRIYVEAGQPRDPVFDSLTADVAAAKAQHRHGRPQTDTRMRLRSLFAVISPGFP